MKSLLAIAFTLALAAAAQAMPVNELPGASNIIQVAGGCGRGWHRGPYGHCLRNYRHPALHRCPRGYHVGRGGRCRANY